MLLKAATSRITMKFDRWCWLNKLFVFLFQISAARGHGKVKTAHLCNVAALFLQQVALLRPLTRWLHMQMGGLIMMSPIGLQTLVLKTGAWFHGRRCHFELLMHSKLEDSIFACLCPQHPTISQKKNYKLEPFCRFFLLNCDLYQQKVHEFVKVLSFVFLQPLLAAPAGQI